MKQQTIANRKSATVHSSADTGLFKRKCACGNHSSGHMECAECARRSKSAQFNRSSLASRRPTLSEMPPLAAGLIESRCGFDFNRIRLHGEQGTIQLQGHTPSGNASASPRNSERATARLHPANAELDVGLKVVRSDTAARLAALSSDGQEDEDVIKTAQVGDAGAGKAPAAPSCSYAMTYANVKTVGCSAGNCGAKIKYDVTGVTATGSGCPKLKGLQVTESVTSDSGCLPGGVTTGGGCQIVDDAGKVKAGCTDTYGLCSSADSYPAAGCTEIYTQKLSVGGVLAETRTITFKITKSKAGCSGTVTRT